MSSDTEMRHGESKPASFDEFLLAVMADCDPDLLLVTAPLHDKCDGDCEGLCTCDGENPSYGHGNPDWERDFSK